MDDSLFNWLKTMELEVEIQEIPHDARVDYIKSFEEPPLDHKDIYWLRYPWQKFGGVSSGIGMVWRWYRDDVIYERCSDEDIAEAYRQTVEYHKNG